MKIRLMALAIYLVAAFISLRAFADDGKFYYMPPSLLNQLVEKTEKEKTVPVPNKIEPTEEDKTAEKNQNEAVAVQVEKLLRAQSALNPEEAPVEAQIEHCLTGECASSAALKNAKFEQCSDKNSYLDLRLQKMEQESPLFKFLGGNRPEIKQVIQPNCVQAFMNTKAKDKKPKNGIFRACSSDTHNTSEKEARPCINERYVNITANSFNLAASCLVNLPLAVKNVAAKIYPQESGFHINAMNPARNDAGSGIGQLTEAAIKDVNNKYIPQIKTMLASSPNSQCRAIESELMQDREPLKSDRSLTCQRLNVEKGNPLLNIIYSLNYINLLDKDLSKRTFSEARYSRKFNLSKHDMERVQEAMVTWGYNIGGTVGTPIKAVLDDSYSGQQVTDADEFISKVRGEIYGYKYAKYSKSGKVKNPARSASINRDYYQKVNQSFEHVNRNLQGGQCLLNP